jgi:hypothetical protein
MGQQTEPIKCYKPDQELTICRECKRNGEANNNEYETFELREIRSSGFVCNGYISVRENGSLFDE